MSNFVTINEDKFEKKTTYSATTLRLGGWESFTQDFVLKYRRIVIMPEQDILVMDIDIKMSGVWPNLNKGKIIMLIDGETVTIDDVHENWHDCKVRERFTDYSESCFFMIDKELLKRICDSKSFSMKLYCGVEGEVENVNAVVVYSKLFYNAVYDNTAYTDVVANALEAFISNNGTFSKIALDGSGANEGGGGCMGMLALLITLTGTAIGGLCALI